MNAKTFFGIGIGLTLFSQPAMAHPGHEALTFYSGFLHPISGLDHLLTAIAVGVWAAGSTHRQGLSSLLKGPLSFLGGMVAGALAGQLGIAFPFCEQGILLSLGLLGLCLFANLKPGTSIGILMLSFFGAFHGNAHGVEVTQKTLDSTALLGLVASTGILHGLGILGVSLIRKQLTEARVTLLLRCMGAGLTGTAFLL